MFIPIPNLRFERPAVPARLKESYLREGRVARHPFAWFWRNEGHTVTGKHKVLRLEIVMLRMTISRSG